MGVDRGEEDTEGLAGAVEAGEDGAQRDFKKFSSLLAGISLHHDTEEGKFQVIF
jgi:hypothetical protein